ncbi:AGE family epimerase/isomerase [Mariniluteicoccus flavus]
MTTRWARHLTEVVLPWWETHGVDDERGGVRTGFDNAGALHSADRFTWSQGRWAWLAGELADEAAAGRLALDEAVWRDRCVRTCARLMAEAVRDDGRTHFRVTESGEPIRDAAGKSATSVFADLFAVLGLAAGLRHVSPADPRAAAWREESVRILETARTGIADRTALSEPYPVPEGFSDLAGPMSLLHTAAELLRAPLGGAEARVRAVRDWAASQLRGQVFSRDGDDWWEMRPDDARDGDTLVARHRTPGHMLELLWMIDRAQEADPGFRLLPRVRLHAVARRAIEIGWDGADGGVLRYVDQDGGRPDGRPVTDDRYQKLVSTTWDTKLWWVHAEAMYALARFGNQDDAELASWAERVIDYTMAVFPSGSGQEWIQIRGRDGTPLDEVVALPVKDPFHIIRALVLLNREHPPRQAEGDDDTP